LLFVWTNVVENFKVKLLTQKKGREMKLGLTNNEDVSSGLKNQRDKYKKRIPIAITELLPIEENL